MAEGKAKPKVDKDDDWVDVSPDEWANVPGGEWAPAGPKVAVPPDVVQSFVDRITGTVSGLGQLAQTGYKAATQPMAALPELKQLAQGFVQPHIEMGPEIPRSIQDYP